MKNTYLRASDLEMEYSLKHVAEKFAAAYEFSAIDTVIAATIEDYDDGKIHRFTFDAKQHFVWDWFAEHLRKDFATTQPFIGRCA